MLSLTYGYHLHPRFTSDFRLLTQTQIVTVCCQEVICG